MYDDQKSAALADDTTYAAYNECSHCGHAGVNDASETDAACSRCDWSGISPKEDKCPGCGEEGTMVSACPKCGARYSMKAEAHLAAPQPADARAGTVPPLSGHWRHGNGVVSCGTLRIFSENFDTQPADAVKNEIVQWVCDTLNAAREAAPQPSAKALTDEQILAEWDKAWDRATTTISIRKVVCATVRALLVLAAEQPGERAAPSDQEIQDVMARYGTHDIERAGGFYTRFDLIEGVRELLAAEQPSEDKRDTAAARDVLAERRRQVESEGWSPEHDDRHPGAMAIAAATYAAHAGAMVGLGYPVSVDAYRAVRGHQVSTPWPWDAEWWKPKDPRRDLVRSGALILAEIERVDRAAIADGEAQSLCVRTRDEVLAKPVADPGGAEHLARSIDRERKLSSYGP